MTAQAHLPLLTPAASPPRLGFLGVGWIGRHRMQALVESGIEVRRSTGSTHG